MVVVVVEVVMEGAMATEVTEYKKIPDPYCCLILLKLIKSLLKFRYIFFCNPSYFLLFAPKIKPHFNTFMIILVLTKHILNFFLLINGSVKIPFYKKQKPQEKKMFSCTVKLFSFERLSYPYFIIFIVEFLGLLRQRRGQPALLDSLVPLLLKAGEEETFSSL